MEHTLQGKHIVLGITGGIAAYKSAELTRLLVKNGVTVQIVMTASAQFFVTPLTFHALSGLPVVTETMTANDAMPHISLGRNTDLMLVAPATADFIARLAQGRADDVLSAACLARDCSLWIAPAMNRQMWQNPATQRNVSLLQQDGIHVIAPASGAQACGEEGAGRLPEPEELLALIKAHFTDTPLSGKPLAGKRVLITAGPTQEAIDPVRVISNLSSGKMGYAMAQAAWEAGAEVTLISGPVCLPAPANVTRIDVICAESMLHAVMSRIPATDIFISVAAVADYRPRHPSSTKIHKSDATQQLELVPTTDILAQVAQAPHAPFCVGFAAETEDFVARGEAKRRRKHLPLLAVNDAKTALGSDDNTLTLLDDDGVHPLPRGHKLVLARQVVTHLASLYFRSPDKRQVP